MQVQLQPENLETPLPARLLLSVQHPTELHHLELCPNTYPFENPRLNFAGKKKNGSTIQ